jgi:phosphate transport system substrate-binding protein
MKTPSVMNVAMFCCAISLTAANAQTTPSSTRPGFILPDGSIRIVGAASMDRVIVKLNSLWAQKHPEAHFKYEKADNNGAIDALIFDATPFAPTDSIYGGGIAYSDIVKATPFFVRVAHGSLQPEARVSPLAVIVNPSNPLSKLAVSDLASIFSKPARARVFTKWSQVGAKGIAGDMTIEPVGLPWSDHYASEDRAFGDDLFFRKFGAAAPVDSYQMFKTYAEVVDFVAREPSAIGIVQLNKVTSAVKVLGLMEGPFGKDRKDSAEDIRSGHYPLDRFLYIYARAQSGKPLEPMVEEYLQMALSPEGQAAIAGSGEGYLPLNSIEVAEEQAKFE